MYVIFILLLQIILEVDCASPIEGQYVTVQKYSYMENEANINEILEIDVEVFCGPFIDSSGNTDTCVIDEPDDACTRKSWALGKSQTLENRRALRVE